MPCSGWIGVAFDREGPRWLCRYVCRVVTYTSRGTGRGGPSDNSRGTPEATKWWIRETRAGRNWPLLDPALPALSSSLRSQIVWGAARTSVLSDSQRGAWAGSWYPERLAQSRPPASLPLGLEPLCARSLPVVCPVSCGEHGKSQQRTVLTQSPWVRAWEALWSLGRVGGVVSTVPFSPEFSKCLGSRAQIHAPTPAAPGSSSSQGWQ